MSLLLASFNGGPPDGVAKVAVAAAILISLAVGIFTRRILLGAFLGAISAAVISVAIVATWRGGPGAEGAIIVFGIGGTVCGGVGGLCGRLVSYLVGRRRSAGDAEDQPGPGP